MKILPLNTSFLAAVISSWSASGTIVTSSMTNSYTPSPIFYQNNRYPILSESIDTSTAISMNLTTQTIVNTSCEDRLDRPESFSVAESVFLALTLGSLIMIMIIGNILVITAIVLERELQRAQYYLVLSLAIADLMVGIVVSPLAALYDINRQWHLGVPMCDFWVVSDVLACTSSILHLLAIALDRYWSITDVSYIQKRTPRRIGIMILIVWIVSFCVSVAPILGWKDTQFTCRVEVRKECLISQAVGYQVFSTTTAFYGPLVLISFLYWKIYKAAKKRIQMQNKRRNNTVSQLRAKILALQSSQDGNERRSTFKRRKTQEKVSVGPKNSMSANGRAVPGHEKKASRGMNQVQIRVTLPSSNDPSIGCLEHEPGVGLLRNGHLNVRNGGDCSSASSCYSLNEDASSCFEEASTQSAPYMADYSSSIPYQSSGIGLASSALVTPSPKNKTSNGQRRPSSHTTGSSDSDSGDGCESPTAPSPLISKEKKDCKLGTNRTRTRSLISNAGIQESLAVSRGARGARGSTFSQTEITSTSFTGCNEKTTAITPATTAAVDVGANSVQNSDTKRRSHPSVQPQISAAGNQKRKKFKNKKESAESSRERRAGRTLAIITGIFVVCWVPFFVLALVRPLLCGNQDTCPIPEYVGSIFLWLGYVNSAVNPIIYTIFSPDFRQAFKRTLQRFCFFKRTSL